MEKYDLHIHSTFSDGELSPTEIAQKAAKNGLSAFSLTDHDTIGGIGEAREAADKLGLQFVPGIELSAFDEFEVHVLGYNFTETPAFAAELERIQSLRKERNYEIIRKLHAHGVKLKVFDEFEDGSKGRSLIAKMLYDQGLVRTRGEAFDKYIGANAPCYVAKMRISPIEAVELITKAGGSAVLAHPYRFIKDGNLETYVEKLAKCGLKGIEVYYNNYCIEVRNELRTVANKFGLFCTGGSDHHTESYGAAIGGVKVVLDEKAKNALGLK